MLSWNQIYQALGHAAGCEARIVHISSDYISDYADKFGISWMRGDLLGDKSHSVLFDNSKIKRFVPDFVATIPFSTGIRQTLKWFEADPSRMILKDETNLFLDGLIENYYK